MLAFAALKIDLFLPASKISFKNSQQVPIPPLRWVSRTRPLFTIEKYRNEGSKHGGLAGALSHSLVAALSMQKTSGLLVISNLSRSIY